MGTKNQGKLTVLAGLFLFTALFAHAGPTGPPAPAGKPPLAEYFSGVAGYQATRAIELDPQAYEMLRLDDYLFTDFTGRPGMVTLYVGLYYSAAKAYAAHSPLICYPSQGWVIDGRPTANSLAAGPYLVNYQEIVTTHDGQRELVLYWHQAHDRSSTKAYRNKIDMAYNQIRGLDQSHAFIRVSVPFADSSREQAKERAVDFIGAFLPGFIAYLATPAKDKSG